MVAKLRIRSSASTNLKIGEISSLAPTWSLLNEVMITFVLLQPFTALYIPDVLFSSIIVQGLNILTWRGLWNFLGSFIFPDDPQFSDLFCLGLGYGLILTVFLLEEPLAFVTLWMNEKGFYFKLIWEDIVYTTIFFCSAILWRGGWNLTAAYVFPDPQMGGWFCFSVGTFLMTTAQIFSLVGAHGVTVDGGEVGRDGIFPTKYLRIYCNGQEPLEVMFTSFCQ